MKKLAVVVLCLFSSFATANDLEELVVKAQRVRVVMIKLADVHRQDPKTGDWYYVEQKAQDKEKTKA
jgi:hypothetical protein